MSETDFEYIKDKKYFDKRTKDKIIDVLSSNDILKDDFINELEKVIDYTNYDTKVHYITEIKRNGILKQDPKYIKLWFIILKCKKEVNLFDDFIEFYLFIGRGEVYDFFIDKLFEYYDIQFLKFRKEFESSSNLKILMTKIDKLEEKILNKEEFN